MLKSLLVYQFVRTIEDKQPRYTKKRRVTYLLPQPHNLETLEVVQLLPSNTPLSALRERAALPLALHLVLIPLLLQRAGADCSW